MVLHICTCVALVMIALATVSGQPQVQRVELPYALADLEPTIDNQTMVFHYGTHYAGYVNNTNAAVANATSSGVTLPSGASDLTGLVQNVKDIPAPLSTTVRNQAGGAWNHALYFKHLAPANTSAAQTSSISPELSAAINSSFGSVENMTAKLTRAATAVFGSGWAWLCLDGNATTDALVITTTPNQDNPLMGDLPGAPAVRASGCTPILGIDVWEHAYYLKHGPRRAAYLTDFWKVVNWDQVSKNYANAMAGNISALVATNSNATAAATPATAGRRLKTNTALWKGLELI